MEAKGFFKTYVRGPGFCPTIIYIFDATGLEETPDQSEKAGYSICTLRNDDDRISNKLELE